MKYRIVKLGTKNHGDSAGYHQVLSQSTETDRPDHWVYVSGSTTQTLEQAEAFLANLIAHGQTEDEVVKEVTV